MIEREQNLLNAAREILSDFNFYGEVLQHGDNGEYGTESAIGILNTAISRYDTPSTGTPAESRYGRKLAELGAQYGREPKPLAQYLAEYVEQEVTWIEPDDIELFRQALDAYESTENVTIKIERVTE